MKYHSSDDEIPITLEDLRALPTDKRIDQALSLEIGYPPGWKFRDAFREVVQNWFDGIRVTNNLNSRFFNTEIRDERFQWVARALHPDSRRLLGFIRFLKKKGSIEVTNFDALLNRRSLNFGGGDKSGNPHLAGGKGEGYKAAAAVALAAGYHYRYEASSCYWKFHVGGKHDPEQIYCELKPTRQIALNKIIASYDEEVITAHNRNEKSYIHKDVTVKIGSVYQSKVSPGISVTEEVFRECIKVSLDLVPPKETIQTSFGDLILDDEFKDTTYIKRRLVEGNSGVWKYKFGYHFHRGSIDRDRRRQPSSKEDAKRVVEIWRNVTNERPDLLQRYIEMMEDENSRWADVYEAKKHMWPGTAKKIAQHYFDLDVTRSSFYYDSRNGDKDIEIVTRNLKKKPKQLVGDIWDVLRKHNLVRTPQEQQEHLPLHATEVNYNGNLYSSSIKRALMASLLLSPKTANLKIVFRAGAGVDLDLLLCGNVLNINEIWLDFNTSHRRAPCSLSSIAKQGDSGRCFSCHHIVVALHRLVMEEVDRHSNGDDDSNDQYQLLLQRVRENLDQMPVMVDAVPTTEGNEVSVSWKDLDMVSRLHGLNAEYRVTLHRESTCSVLKYDLITSQQAEVPSERGQYFATCGCPETIELQLSGKALFTGLSANEHYFPMIARTDLQSFFRVSAKIVQPNLPMAQNLNENRLSASSPAGPRTGSGSGPYASPKADKASKLSRLYIPEYTDMSSDNDYDISLAMSVRSQSPRTVADSPVHGVSTEAKHQLERYRSEVDLLRAHIAEKDESLQHLETKLIEAESEAHRAKAQLEQYEKTVNDLEEQLELMRGASESAEKQGQLKQAYDTALTEIETLRATLKIARDELCNKQSELQGTAKAIIDLQTREANANDTIIRLQDRVEELHISNEKLESDLDMAQDVNNKQALLAANRLQRKMSATRVKHEVDQGVEIKDEHGRPRKRVRPDDTSPEYPFVID